MVKDGQLAPCEFITVESEFAAMSAAIGASAAGARAYTATASQGLLYMAEALFNASGLGLPIVMTVANRAIGAPINIWNDHSDSMSQRDCGWVQLYAEDNQDAVDLHVLAFRLAEELSRAGDGLRRRLRAHPRVRADRGAGASTSSTRSCRRYRPRQLLDPDEPVTIGAMVGPEAFTEVRYLADQQLRQADRRCPTLAAELRRGHRPRGRRGVATYRTDGRDTVVVTLGSVSAPCRTRSTTVADVRRRPAQPDAVPAVPGRGGAGGPRRRRPRRRARAGVRAGRRRRGLGRRADRAGRAGRRRVSTVVAGLGGRAGHQGGGARLLADQALDGACPTSPSWTCATDVVERELARTRPRVRRA